MMDDWHQRWKAFSRATRLGWCVFPEWLQEGLWLCRASRQKPRPQSHLLAGWRFWRQRRSFELPASLTQSPCPVLLFPHHRADNARAPVDALARRLAERGVNSLVWAYDGAWLWRRGGDGVETLCLTPAMRRLEQCPFSSVHALRCIAYGFVATVALIGVLLLRGRLRLVPAWAEPFRLWNWMCLAHHRRLMASRVMRAIGARAVLATHSRHRPASAFLATARRAGARRLLYSHAPPAEFDFPSLADEILVWNTTAADEWKRSLQGRGERPTISVVGNWEVDLVLRGEDGATETLPLVEHEGPALLFLSQCTGLDDPKSVHETQVALDWIRTCAARHPRWRFLLKERRYDDGLTTLLARGPLPPNVEVVGGDASYIRLLRHPSIRAVAAYSSSGLFVAAGAGKRALRLLTSRPAVALPVIDEVVEPIAGPEELARALESMADESSPGRTEPHPAVGDRILGLCLQSIP